MREVWTGVRALLYGRRERGQTLTEYALIIAFVAIVLVTALTFLGSNLEQIYTNISETYPF